MVVLTVGLAPAIIGFFNYFHQESLHGDPNHVDGSKATFHDNLRSSKVPRVEICPCSHPGSSKLNNVIFSLFLSINVNIHYSCTECADILH